MKHTKDELIEIVKSHGEALGEDNMISLLEDISDSFVEAPEPDYTGYVAQAEYDALKQKYIDRFSGGGETTTQPETPVVETPETEEPSLDEVLGAYI